MRNDRRMSGSGRGDEKPAAEMRYGARRLFYTAKLSLTEALLKLDLVARHCSNPQKQPYDPVLSDFSDLKFSNSAVTSASITKSDLVFSRFAISCHKSILTQ